MRHPLPHAIDFAEQMFMFYAERIMRAQFRSTQEQEYCQQQADIYYQMMERLYPFEPLILDYQIPLQVIY